MVGFDTATADTAVCAVRGGEVVHEELLGLSSEGSPRHSTALLAEIERAVEACGGWDGVGGLAVGRGPGSFVGIRIGLATARGLAASTGVPATGVCTLDALGRALVEAGGGDALAVLDARRGEVFAALYAADGERLWEPLVLPPEELGERVAELPVSPLAAGSGAVRFRQELAKRGIEILADADPVHHVSARQVCALAADGADGPLEPIYLRPPDAQRWRERHDSQRAG
ncbi:MAG TPA: tRNA (adenosine(37)-N6)-threonylcarbamoyltransferase complex dimerization subunit type 1 TsaB [Solirubrobacterales bacterium]|nr:tRNA (adenosine(37)-N6)-threonylcarbamoyltransferase complex dimerization subunit type 1 TsaB [Solirubrobacterales bacterium]